MDNTKAFNTSQRKALAEICAALGKNIKNLRYYVAYWDENGKFESRELNITEKSDQEPHNYLNYYWAVYQRGDEQYRITMYYKDFDHGSGNIHVYPGAVQVWKRMCLEEKDKKKFINGFCGKDLKYVKKTRDGEIHYPMIGGTAYCEYGWMPLLDSAFFWNNENLSGLMDCIKKETYKCVGRGIYSNQFYREVRNYSEKGRSGHYIRYSLFRFQGESLFYKTMLIEGKGYFTKFDGEEVTYAKGGEENPNGPNYYDTEKERWMINEKQFNDEKEENA